jgi:hypothetical protein
LSFSRKHAIGPYISTLHQINPVHTLVSNTFKIHFNIIIPTPIDYWREIQRERDHCEDPDVGGWIILRRILERWDVVMWTGLVWLRIDTGGELL